MPDLTITKVHKDVNTYLTIGTQLVEKSERLAIVVHEDVQIATQILKDCQKVEKDLESKRQEITKPLNDFLGEVNTLFKQTAHPILEAKNTIKGKIVAFNQEQERLKRIEEERLLAEERARLKKLEEERLERERIERERQAAEQKRLDEERARLKKIEEERIAKELEANRASEEAQRRIKEEADRQRLEREKIENERLELERQKRELEEERKRREEEQLIENRKREQLEQLAKKQAQMKVKGIVKRWVWQIVDENKIPRTYCSSDAKKINEAVKAGVRSIDGIQIFEANTVR